VAPSSTTVGEWLSTWIESVVKPSRRPKTVATYLSVIISLTKSLGKIRLQALLATDLMRY
jgi:hypothetical protein